MELNIFWIVLLFILLFVACFGFSLILLRKRVRLGARVSANEELSRLEVKSITDSISKIAKPIGQKVPRSAESLSREEAQLVTAGFRNKDAVFILYGVRVLLFMVAIAVLLVTGLLWAQPLLYLLLGVLIALVLPDGWLRWKVSRRKLAIEHGLPDFMDLAVVCVEAGLGLDQTIHRVGNELRLAHSDLAEELRLYSLEVSAGRSRADALRNLSIRSAVDELRSFAAVLIQADRFGTSIAQTLRVFAEDLRVKRRQKAEEKAAKLTVKLVFPLVFFIFPAILVVAAGPAVIAIFKDLFGRV